MEIVKNFDNKLLHRKEIVGTLANSGVTPSRIQVRKEIAKKLKVDDKLVVVNKISSSFGNSNVTIEAVVYEKKETLEKLTHAHIKKRNQFSDSDDSEGSAESEEKKEEE